MTANGYGVSFGGDGNVLGMEIMVIVAQLSEYAAAAAESLQSCPTLCDPMDGSSPGQKPSE